MRRALLFAVLLLPGCDGGSSDVDPPVTPTPIDPATVGTIRGKVLFKGEPPANPKLPVGGNAECSSLHSDPALDEVVLAKNGRLQNVFVYVKQGLEQQVFEWPKTPVTMANRKCVYEPRVIGAQVHQPIRFVNDDPTDHNVHGFPSGGEFNFVLRGRNTQGERKIRRPEVMVSVKCDLHNWMIGYVGVLPHPFFRVTGPDGAFELKGLPPGDYVIEAWHEKYGTQTAGVKLEARGSAEADFTFPK